MLELIFSRRIVLHHTDHVLNFDLGLACPEGNDNFRKKSKKYVLKYSRIYVHF